METLTISKAKQQLGKVADEALQGKTVVIIRKGQLLTLSKYTVPEPIPIPPTGYFDDCYTKVEAKASNRLGAHSARKIVR